MYLADLNLGVLEKIALIRRYASASKSTPNALATQRAMNTQAKVPTVAQSSDFAKGATTVANSTAFSVAASAGLKSRSGKLIVVCFRCFLQDSA